MNNYKINVINGEMNSINEIFISSLIKEIKKICKKNKNYKSSSCIYLNKGNKNK